MRLIASFSLTVTDTLLLAADNVEPLLMGEITMKKYAYTTKSEKDRYEIILDARRKGRNRVKIYHQSKEPSMWDGELIWVNKYLLSRDSMYEVALIIGRDFSRHPAWLELWENAFFDKYNHFYTQHYL